MLGGIISHIVKNNNYYVNLREASRLSGYAQDYLGQLIRLGKLNGTRTGRDWFIKLSELENYLGARGRKLRRDDEPKLKLSINFLSLREIWRSQTEIKFPDLKFKFPAIKLPQLKIPEVKVVLPKFNVNVKKPHVPNFAPPKFPKFNFRPRAVAKLLRFARPALASLGALALGITASSAMIRIKDTLTASVIETTNATGLLAGQAGHAYRQAGAMIDLVPEKFTGVTKWYGAQDQKVSGFLGDRYIAIVQKVVPGYSPYKEVGLTAEEANKLLSDLRAQRKAVEELATLQQAKGKEKPGKITQIVAPVVGATREGPQRIVRIIPIKEIEKEVEKEIEKIADSDVLTIQGDISALKKDIVSLRSGLTYEQGQSSDIINYVTNNIVNGNVSLPRDMLAATLELRTNVGKIGLIVDQQSVNDIVRFQDNGRTVFSIADGGNVGIGATSPSVSLDIRGTDAILIPAGTNAQRPTGAAGMFRFNTAASSFEGYNGSTWGDIGGGAAGLFTDGGDFTYLTAIADDLALGASTVAGAPFNFDVSASAFSINIGDGDPIINFQTATTTRWGLGVDDSDLDKFRIAQGGAFNSTSSGITLDASGNTGIGVTGPSGRLSIGNSNTEDYIFQVLAGGTTIFNEQGRDIDFRLESAGRQYMLFVDAGNNRIGINTPDAAPASIFEIQDNDTGLGVAGQDVVLTINNASTTSFDPYIAFATASTTRWRVGVDHSDSNIFRIADGGFNATTSGITIRGSSGNIGLGTTNPQGRLHVIGGISYFGDDVTNASTTQMIGDGDVYIERNLEVDGTIYGNLIGTITQSPFVQGSVIFAGAGGGQTEDNDQLFWDNDTADKLLGIGTLTPSSRLEIQDNATGNSVVGAGRDVILTINNASTTAFDPYIRLQSASTDRWRLGFDDSDRDIFRITPLGGAFNATTSGITLDSSGNLGIGVTNPDASISQNHSIVINNNAIIGAATSITETLANAGFAINGDDLFVAGTVGVEGSIYTDGSFIAGSTLTVSDGSIVQSSGNLTIAAAAGSNIVATTTLAMNNTAGGDPNILFQDSGTTRWVIGLDNPSGDSSDFLRITQSTNFAATTTGITLVPPKNDNAFVGIGTTNPLSMLELADHGGRALDGTYDHHFGWTALTISNAHNMVTGPGSHSMGTGIWFKGFPDAAALGTDPQEVYLIGTDVNASAASTVAKNNFFMRDMYATGDPVRMFVSSTGQVGIGTTGPAGRFELNHNRAGYDAGAGADVVLTINNASTTSFDPYVDFQTNSVSAWRLGVDDSDSDKFRIAQGGSFSATSSGLTIGVNGFVGIGTTNPSTALHVNATTTIDDGLVVGASDLYVSSNGLVGIGDSSPSAQLEIGNGTDSIQFSSVGDITFVDADGAASITGPAGGALTVAGGASQALTLTGNAASTWSLSAGTLTLSVISTEQITASSTLAINNTSGNDPYIIFEDIGTDRWYLGFDNSDGDKLRITPLAGSFSATSSGLTIGVDGFVGIGVTNPAGRLELGDGTDAIRFSTVGDITFVDADGAASITGPAGGALTVAGGASQALTLTGNAASTWSLSAGTLTLSVISTEQITASSTLAINNTSGNDPYIIFEDIGTDRWYLGFDNSDSDKLRITPAGSFTATSSGLTIGVNGFVGIGTTNPSSALHVNATTTIDDGLVVGTSDLYVSSNGLVGIGDSSPSAQLEIGNGTDSIQFSSVGDITFVDADGAASITGPAGGALTVAGGASQALTLTGNAASTWSLSAGTLTLSVISTEQITASSTLAINNTSGNDPYIIFEDIGTDKWYLGFDNSDADKFRITPAGSFTATSSGITILPSGFVGIGTTAPGNIVHVQTDAGRQVAIESTVAGQGAGFNVLGPANADWVMLTDRVDLIGAADNLGFYKQAGTTGTKMVLTDAGNVGIGDTTPQHLLTISSGSSASTTLVINNNDVGDAMIQLQLSEVTTWKFGLDNSDADKFRITPLAGSFSATSSGLTIGVDGFVGIGTTNPTSMLSINATGIFAYGDFNTNLVADFEGVVTDWVSNATNTVVSAATSTDSGRRPKVGTQALKIDTTEGESASSTGSKAQYDHVRKTPASTQDWSSYERLSFWILSTQTSTTTDQIINFNLHDSGSGTTTHNITIKEINKWQYEEVNLAATSTTGLDAIDYIQFQIRQDTDSPNFFIDHMRVYDDDERAQDLFVDADGNVVLTGRGGVELVGPTVSSGQLPGVKVGAATVEIGKPLAVNVGGDVGFDYDIQFLNTGTSYITSEGPLKILAGDANHVEDLTLGTQGTGGVIVDIQGASTTYNGFKVLGDRGTVFTVTANGNVGIGTGEWGTSATATSTNVLAIKHTDNPPTASITDGILLYATSTSNNAELVVRDEVGNQTVLSPHRNSLFTPDPSYKNPFSFWSRNEKVGREINVDMYGAIRQVELLTGQRFIYTRDLDTGSIEAFETSGQTIITNASTGIPSAASFTKGSLGLNDLSVTGPCSCSASTSFALEIDGTNPDTARVSHDGGSSWIAAKREITGAMQNIGIGLQASAATTGHIYGDRWNFSASSTVISSITYTAGPGLNDFTSGGIYSGTASLDYLIQIDGNSGDVDTVRVSQDGGVAWIATGVAIKESGVTASNGVTFKFDNRNGHAVGDYWYFTATPSSSNLFTIQTRDGQKVVIVEATGNVGIVRKALAVCNTAVQCANASRTAGNIYATSRTGGAIDIAEWIKVVDSQIGKIEPGELIAPSNATSTRVEKSSRAYQKNIIGVVSTAPHLTMGAEYEGEDAVRMAIAGRVPVKVSGENGPIDIGDRLTSASSTPGYAMKATKDGHTIGVALEPFSISSATATSSILVFLDLGYADISPETEVSPGFTFKLDESTGNQVLKLANTTGDTLLSIDTRGNIGIGRIAEPAQPVAIAQGMGSAIADGWDVYSLEEYKTNIEYFDEEDYESVLEKIKAMPIARYNYKSDVLNNGAVQYSDSQNTDPVYDPSATKQDKRLGFIVEKSPKEIIAKTKQGISLYDLAAFTLAGVKELANQYDSLETRVAALEIRLDEMGGIASATSTDTAGELLPPVGGQDASGFLASLKDSFISLGAKISDGFARFTELVTGRLVIERGDPLGSAISTLAQDTIGEGVILAGATSTEVTAPILGIYDKVFITPEKPVTLGVVGRRVGEGLAIGMAAS